MITELTMHNERVNYGRKKEYINISWRGRSTGSCAVPDSATTAGELSAPGTHNVPPLAIKHRYFKPPGVTKQELTDELAINHSSLARRRRRRRRTLLVHVSSPSSSDGDGDGSAVGLADSEEVADGSAGVAVGTVGVDDSEGVAVGSAGADVGAAGVVVGAGSEGADPPVSGQLSAW